jgi:hypothetical protein
MLLAVTGFVSEEAGSVASANALMLRALLDAGLEIDFFSKPSFIDPRPAVGEHKAFRFVPVINSYADGFRRTVESIPMLGASAAWIDSVSYNRLLVRRIGQEHRRRSYDAILWMGDYAHGGVPGVPTISFAQGPPGTDARSLLARSDEVRRLAGGRTALKWRLLARLRLSPLGLPAFRHSDHFIVGSSISRDSLIGTYGLPGDRVSTAPYPIDLDLFQHSEPEGSSIPASQRCYSGPLRLLWLGRIIPRKRIDLFLDGADIAIQQGLDMRVTIVGRVGFVPGYERLINEWPHQDRLTWIQGVARGKVPDLMHAHDLLVQPSEEENFGSSVAEAQSCGMPVIIGELNGNADYLCERDIRLRDYRPETLAESLQEMARRRGKEDWGDPMTSRRAAEAYFSISHVTGRLIEILEGVVKGHGAAGKN